jgi:hypothetical protein
MDAIRCRSSAYGPSGWHSIFPSQPAPRIAVHPYSLQRYNRINALARSMACLRSLRAMACIIAVALPLACPITALPFVGARAATLNVSHADPANRFAEFIAEASDRFLVPPRWIRAVMQIESGGDEHSMSPRGAMGLMQIMPGTWVELSVRYGLGLDPFDPRDNILAGTAYLKEMHDRFGSAGFLAAYHAGPLRYEQHLTTGRRLPPVTLAYVAAITPLLASEQSEPDPFDTRRAVPWRQAPLFIERANAALADDRSAPNVGRTSQPSARLTVGSSMLAPLAADLFVRPLSADQSR